MCEGHGRRSGCLEPKRRLAPASCSLSEGRIAPARANGFPLNGKTRSAYSAYCAYATRLLRPASSLGEASEDLAAWAKTSKRPLHEPEEHAASPLIELIANSRLPPHPPRVAQTGSPCILAFRQSLATATLQLGTITHIRKAVRDHGYSFVGPRGSR